MADKEETAEESGGGKKKMIIILVAVLAIAGAGYFFFLKPSGDAEAMPGATPTVTHEPGPVLELDELTINLAGGHYLKLAMALQTTPDAGEISGAKALDAAIALFSNKTMDELSDLEGREAAKAELVKMIGEEYDDTVYDIYFTQFVMQ